MAVITASTFDPLKARCNVRLQQAVPIVDADWNELDDIRKFEMRAYLKWHVGDGIPDGSDGFRIDALAASADDFVIRAGVPAAAAGTSNFDIGLRNCGRCIVDGLDVIIQADINYQAQTLFAGPGLGGAPQIQPIPVIAGNVVVYLDVWERLVTSQEDPSQVLRGLGTESCARMKREWCVRTRQQVPVSEVLAEWRAANARTRDGMRRLGRQGTLQTSAGPYPAGLQAFHYSSELATHADDVGVPVSQAEDAGRTHWRAVFGAFALGEQGRPVTVALAGGTIRVTYQGQDEELSEHEFVDATVCRLPGDTVVPARLRAVLCFLA